MAWVRCCGGGKKAPTIVSKSNGYGYKASSGYVNVDFDVEAGKHYKLYWGATAGSDSPYGGNANWTAGQDINDNGNATITTDSSAGGFIGTYGSNQYGYATQIVSDIVATTTGTIRIRAFIKGDTGHTCGGGVYGTLVEV